VENRFSANLSQHLFHTTPEQPEFHYAFVKPTVDTVSAYLVKWRNENASKDNADKSS
jgi:hypothetical protein